MQKAFHRKWTTSFIGGEMSLKFHTKVLKNRFIRMRNSVTLAIGEDDPEIIKLDEEQIKDNFRMLKVQMERVKKRID